MASQPTGELIVFSLHALDPIYTERDGTLDNSVFAGGHSIELH
jgi:hypothetical protein